jgi:RimJ/RimL family protein N-acetyltransferase
VRVVAASNPMPVPTGMLSEETLDIVDEYWAQDLGCTRGELRPPAPRLQVHGGGLEGYAGVFILVLDGAAPVVSAPPDLGGLLSARAARFTADAVSRPDVLRSLLEPMEVAPVIGPAVLNYADAAMFKSGDLAFTRALEMADRAEFETLKAACERAEWDPKGFDLDGRRTFGAFNSGGELLAVANFEVWAERIAHLRVVAHPQVRGQGYGPRAIGAAATCALDSNLVLQYRALRENRASLRVAAKLGFQAYGWSIAARFAA